MRVRKTVRGVPAVRCVHQAFCRRVNPVLHCARMINAAARDQPRWAVVMRL